MAKPPSRSRDFLQRLDLVTLRDPERRYLLLTRFEALRQTLRKMGFHPEDLDGFTHRGLALSTVEKTLAMSLVYCGFHYERALEVLQEPCGLDAGAVKHRASILRQHLNSPDDVIGPATQLLLNSNRVQVDLTPERTLLELYRVAMGDLGDILNWDERGGLSFTPSDQLSPAQRAMIAELTVTTGRGGEVTAKLRTHDKLKALELLAKHQGLLTERMEMKVDISIADRLERARSRVLDGVLEPSPALPAPSPVPALPVPETPVITPVREAPLESPTAASALSPLERARQRSRESSVSSLLSQTESPGSVTGAHGQSPDRAADGASVEPGPG